MGWNQGGSSTQVALIASLGLFLYGYDVGVISGALLYIVPEFSLEHRPEVEGLVVSGLLMGAMVGTLGGGPVADLWGRRSLLVKASGLFVVGAAAMAWSPSVWLLVGARGVVGLGIGAIVSVIPVYIIECAAGQERGALATIPQVMVSSGILTSYTADLLISLSPSPSWRLMLGISLLPALAFATFLRTLPESPRWLVLQGRTADARAALTCLRGAGAIATVERELEALIAVTLGTPGRQDTCSGHRLAAGDGCQQSSYSLLGSQPGNLPTAISPTGAHPVSHPSSGVGVRSGPHCKSVRLRSPGGNIHGGLEEDALMVSTLFKAEAGALVKAEGGALVKPGSDYATVSGRDGKFVANTVGGGDKLTATSAGPGGDACRAVPRGGVGVVAIAGSGGVDATERFGKEGVQKIGARAIYSADLSVASTGGGDSQGDASLSQSVGPKRDQVGNLSSEWAANTLTDRACTSSREGVGSSWREAAGVLFADEEEGEANARRDARASALEDERAGGCTISLLDEGRTEECAVTFIEHGTLKKRDLVVPGAMKEAGHTGSEAGRGAAQTWHSRATVDRSTSRDRLPVGLLGESRRSKALLCKTQSRGLCGGRQSGGGLLSDAHPRLLWGEEQRVGSSDACPLLPKGGDGDGKEGLLVQHGKRPPGASRGPRWADVLRNGQTQRGLLVGMTLQIMQQLVGINVVVYFTPIVLRSSGATSLFLPLGLSDRSSAILATILSYSLKVPSGLIALSMMDHVNRRTMLLLYSLGPMGVALLALALDSLLVPEGSLRAILAVLLVAIYGSTFVLGMGPVPSILCSELYPTAVRGMCMSACTAANFIANIIVSQLFPTMELRWGLPGVFAFFSGMCVVAWVFVAAAVPETRGISLEDLSYDS